MTQTQVQENQKAANIPDVYKKIPIAFVRPSQTNPRKRFDQAADKDLMESVKKHGVIQPILVRQLNVLKEDYEIVAGERRYRAAKALGMFDIPAVIRILDEKDALEIQVIENLQRSDLHPLEEAEGYEKLIKDHGYASADEVAAKIGKSRSYVYGRMKLCALVNDARRAFYDGVLNPSTALLIARIPAQFQLQALKEITKPEYSDEPMTYREAMEHIHDNYTLQLSDAPFDTKDAGLFSKAGACTLCPKRTGNQPELFPDIKRADVCTDPACFKVKKESSWKKQTEKFAKEGNRILPVDAQNIGFSGKDLYSMRYVLLNGKCEDDPKNRTYAQLLKEQLDPKDIVVAKDGTGAPRQLVTRRTVENLFKQSGIKFERSGSSVTPMTKEEKEQAERESKMKEEIDRVVCMNVAEAYVKKIESLSPEKALNGTVFQLLLELDCSVDDAILQRRGVKIKDFLKYAAGLSLSGRIALVVEMAMVLNYSSWGSGGNDNEKCVCLGYGLDYKKIAKEAEVQVKEKFAAAEKAVDVEKKDNIKKTKAIKACKK